MPVENRIISYREMCDEVGVQVLQRGMNYQIRPGLNVILMSLRSNAPYPDRIEDEGRVLIYEGHDAPRILSGPDPKTCDQPQFNPSGSLTQNGLFYQAAIEFAGGISGRPLPVRVYQKIWSGVWTDNGTFELVDAWIERRNERSIFKFKMLLSDFNASQATIQSTDLEHNRIIPPEVKLQVWKRDHGRCVQCGATDNLHFDHIIPFSAGWYVPNGFKYSIAVCKT